MSPRAGCCGPPEGRRSPAGPCPAGCPAAGCFSSSQKPEGALSGSLCELLVISRDVACGDFSLVGKSCPCWKCKHMHTTPSHGSGALPRAAGDRRTFSQPPDTAWWPFDGPKKKKKKLENAACAVFLIIPISGSWELYVISRGAYGSRLCPVCSVWSKGDFTAWGATFCWVLVPWHSPRSPKVSCA